MSDLRKWNVHGSVHTLRTEFAEWDLSKQEWQAPRRVNLVRFLHDGRMSGSESHNPDGSVSASTYQVGVHGHRRTEDACGLLYQPHARCRLMREGMDAQ